MVIPRAVDVFVTRRASQEIGQARLVANPDGTIGWTLLRTFQLPIPDGGEAEDAQSEGLVFDRSTGTLYIGQEGVGVWSANADWRSGSGRVATELLHPTTVVDPAAILQADVEGLTIRSAPGEPDLLLVSSQGDDTFAAFGRAGGHPKGPFTELIGRFTVADAGDIDGAQESDGADVTLGRPRPGSAGGPARRPGRLERARAPRRGRRRPRERELGLQARGLAGGGRGSRPRLTRCALSAEERPRAFDRLELA